MATPIFAGAAGDPFSIGSGLDPAVATDATGHVIVIWQLPNGGLAGQVYTPDGTPATEELDISPDPNDGRPAVTWLPSGDLAVAWERRRGNLKSDETDVILQVMARPIGGGRLRSKDVGDVIQIPNAAHPAVGADDQGRVAVAWVGLKDNPGSDAGVYHFIAGLPLSDGDSVVAKARPIGGGRLLGTAGPATPPGLAVRDSGEILVVWENAGKDVAGAVLDFDDLFSDGDALRAKARPIGGGRFNESTSGVQSNPAVTVAFDSGFALVWERTLPSGARHVITRRFTSDGEALTGDVQVSIEASTETMMPSVAADSVGNTIVTWRGASETVTARSLTVEGRAAGNDFRVDTKGSAGRARVTPAANGADFLVIWEKRGDRIFGSFLMGPFDLR